MLVDLHPDAAVETSVVSLPVLRRRRAVSRPASDLSVVQREEPVLLLRMLIVRERLPGQILVLLAVRRRSTVRPDEVIRRILRQDSVLFTGTASASNDFT